MADTNKLATFLTTNKLNAKRLLAVSHKLETLQRADRTIKLGQRQGKKAAEAGTAVEGEKKEIVKPRSGRPVTPRALEFALAGKAVSGPTKHRILRAINFLLEQKKKDKVELRTLF
jgi:excinuclease UvrABC ATPase subunit